MSVLVVSDLHLSSNPRDSYRFKFMSWLRERAYKYEAVIVNGDITEEKDRHPSVLVNAIVDEFAPIANDTRLVFNMGNHDYTDIEHPFFAFLGHLPRTVFIQSPSPNAGGMGSQGWNIGLVMFLPHTTNWKRDWKKHMLQIGKSNYVFAHQTFIGTRMQNGHVTGNVPTDIFGKAKVFSGDVHTPGHVDGVQYIGAPYTVDFGDLYQGRVLEVKGPKEFKWIDYHGPQKRLVVFEAKRDDDVVLKEVEACNAGDIVKVRVHLDAHNRSEWSNVRKIIDKWAKHRKVELHSVVPVMDKGGSIKATRRSYAKKTDEELLAVFVKARDLDKATAKLGSILMRKV